MSKQSLTIYIRSIILVATWYLAAPLKASIHLAEQQVEGTALITRVG